MPPLTLESLPDYLKKHLIAYIGNKRSLLPFLSEIFEGFGERSNRSRGVFLDPFAGSGAVARLARVLGFQVAANDWEPYSRVMNTAFLTLSPSDLAPLFFDKGGVQRVWTQLNALKRPRQEYFAKYYAPAEGLSPDYRRERLFYTRENALFLDAVREGIEDLYPEEGSAKTLLLACLVYEASVHSNTSGVFKAFHKGFGGHAGDALPRILKPMELEIPLLWEGVPSVVGGEDAQAFVRSRAAEICYLDPPYNQHQYGSNYHLLNTLVLNDKPVYGLEVGPKGRLLDKAGIRKDWTKTRSPFCIRKSASLAFRDLLDAVDSRWIVVSYNTEGVVPFEELFSLLEVRGSVDLRIQDYVTYRGGRQSPSRRVHNLELVLTVNTQSRSTSKRPQLRRFLLEKKLENLLRRSFHPERLTSLFPNTAGTLCLAGQEVRTQRCYLLLDQPDFQTWDLIALEDVVEKLSLAACASHQEETEVLTMLLENETETKAIRRWERRLLKVLRKFAFAKYRREITDALKGAGELAARSGSPLLKKGLEELETLTRKRLEG